MKKSTSQIWSMINQIWPFEYRPWQSAGLKRLFSRVNFPFHFRMYSLLVRVIVGKPFEGT